MKAVHPFKLAALAVLLGTGLFGTMRALRHARLIADTPTARIASAAQGSSTYNYALAIAKAATPLGTEIHDEADPLGVKVGDSVTVMADDYGRDPVQGTLVAAAERRPLAR